jgi:nucleoside-diphosphate-sugar epimerase
MAHHLITGGNGFVGSRIAKALLDIGEKVTIIDVIEDANYDKRSTFLKLDILNLKELKTILKDVDYVHHTAALVPLKKAGKLFWEVNVVGTKNVIEACKENNVKHMTHISSSAVFGNVTKKDCPIGINPGHLFPIEIYGRSKSEGENLVLSEINHPKSNTTFSIIRPRTIIGTERLGIFEILYEWITENRNIYIIGSGNNIFQFVHLHDVVTASIKACQLNRNEIFNVGAAKYGTLRQDLESLIRYAKSTSKVISLPVYFAVPILYFLDKIRLSPLGPWHYLTYHKDYYFDIENTKKKLNWQPKYTNQEMLKESYRWYIKNKHRDFKNLSAHKSKLKQGILSIIKKFS